MNHSPQLKTERARYMVAVVLMICSIVMAGLAAYTFHHARDVTAKAVRVDPSMQR